MPKLKFLKILKRLETFLSFKPFFFLLIPSFLYFEQKISDALSYASNSINSITENDIQSVTENSNNYFQKLNEISKELSKTLEISDEKKININSNNSRESFYISIQKTESLIEDLNSILTFSKQFLQENNLKLNV